MDAETPPAATTPEPAVVPRRKGPPAWGVALFLVLLAGVIVTSQWLSTSGAPVQWIDDDLAAALAQAQSRHCRVFLYLYEPNDPIHARNEREVFAQRWARRPLEQAVSCRVALRPGDVRRVKYGYEGRPLFLLLDAKGNRQGPAVSGAVDEREFMTFIGRPALDYAAQQAQKASAGQSEGQDGAHR